MNAALEEAIKRGHEYVTLEHLLFALLNDQTASTVVVQCGGDSEALKAGLEQFFDEQQEGLQGNQTEMPEPTVLFQRNLPSKTKLMADISWPHSIPLSALRPSTY